MSFSEYVQAGWVLCELKPGTKAPKGDGWQTREGGIRDPHRADRLLGAGICHAWSGTCALDIDNWDVAEAFLKTQGIDLHALFGAPESVQISSGRQGRGKLLYRLLTPLPTIQLAPYKAPGKKDPTKLETFHGLELRCATKGGLSMHDCAPPSIHPETGMPYTWVYGDPVLGHWSELPALPAALEALWTAQREPLTSAPVEDKAARGATVAELQTLLDGRDPEDCAYDDWLAVGMAIHHEVGGSEEGYWLWHNWSARCSKHDPAFMPAKWRSFGQAPGDHVTLGSLLQSRTALPEEFGITSEVPEDRGTDTRLSTAVDKVLQRVVYLLDQERYYHQPLPKGHEDHLTLLDRVGKKGLKASAFDTLYYPVMPNEVVKGKDGQETLRRIDPKKAVRQSVLVPRVNGLGFHPGQGRIYTEIDGNHYLNDYVPIKVEPLRPKPLELDAWAFLCSRIPHDLYRSWLLKFYAFALAKPGVKIQSAPLLVSDTQGTGKTTWMQTIPQLLYGMDWVREVSSDLLGKTFNAFLASTWWVSIEELKTDGPRMDSIAIANKLKPWITSKKIPVEFKGLDAYDMYNRVQITASSNSRLAVQLDNSDRRWGVARAVEEAMTEAQKAGLYGDFLNTPRAPGVVRWLVQQENLTGFSPTALPPITEEKTSMTVAGYGQWETGLAELIVDRKAPFDRDVVTLEEVQETLRSKNIGLSRKRLGMLLRRTPFFATVRSNGKSVLYCWNNVRAWGRQDTAEWTTHVEVGTRPAGDWEDKAPLAIRLAAGEDDEPETNFDDLLGAL